MNPLEQHMERCTKCGICIDVCPRYGNIELIDTLYNFLRGDIATPDYDVKRCLTCNLCTSECPEELGIKMLISAARAKITKLQGITPAQKIADPFSSRNIFRKFSEYRKPCTFAREGVDGELLFFRDVPERSFSRECQRPWRPYLTKQVSTIR